MPGSSDDSDAECDDPQVVVNRYKQAQHRAALSSPQLHQRACQELAELHSIITQCTSARVRKAILAEVMSDTRLAVELCDGVARNTLACRTLVADAVQCLPHAKGREISRLLKAKSVKAARHHHKMTTSNQDAAPVIQQIPTEVLGLVLDQLDPFALAAAACTSRQWQQEAYKEHRWQVFCRTLMGDAGRAADSSISRRKTFYLTATVGHSRMAYFRHRRRMLKSTLLWTEAEFWQEPPDLECITPKQVARFIVKGTAAECDCCSDSDGSDDEGSLWARGPCWMSRGAKR